MKNIILIMLVFIISISCQNKQINKLKVRVASLEKLNEKLKDSLYKANLNEISSLEMIMLPEYSYLKLNKKNKVRGYLFEHKNFKSYNLYRLDTLFTGYDYSKRDLLLENYTKSDFVIDFTPKSKKDNSIYLLAEFNFDNETILVPGVMYLSVK